MRLQRAFSATRIVLVLLCLMYFITYIDRVNVSTAASAFKQEFGLSNTQVGFVFSAFAYPYLVFQIIGGWLGGVGSLPAPEVPDPGAPMGRRSPLRTGR